MEPRAIVREFGNVTRLIVRGYGSFALDDAGTLQGVRNVTRDGSELTCTCSLSNSFDGTNVIDGTDNVGVNNLRITQNNVRGGAQLIYGTDNVVNNVEFGNVHITQNNFHGMQNVFYEVQSPRNHAPAFKLDPSVRLESIVLQGTTGAKVALQGATSAKLAPAYLADRFQLLVEGAAIVILPAKRFVDLNVVVHGRGTVRGKETSSTTATFLVQGSGRIYDVLIHGAGSITVQGCGTVQVSSKCPDALHMTTQGLGRIAVNPIDAGVGLSRISPPGRVVKSGTKRGKSNRGSAKTKTPLPKRAKIECSKRIAASAPRKVSHSPNLVTIDLSESSSPSPCIPEPILRPHPYPDEPSAADGEPECAICMDRSVRTCIFPCGHCVLCVTCARLSISDCPLCQSSIHSVIRTYAQ